ncbi:MAG: hypothetical protein NT024_00500 [Proteobacteria bacterium]|nr:hypothetical protein [Pseudomonadota bacterium]
MSTHAVNHYQVTLVQPSFDCYMIDATPENLIGERAYDSDKLNAELREQGTLGVPSDEFPRLRAIGGPLYPSPTILR